MWDLEIDPVKHAQKMIAHIDKKREALRKANPLRQKPNITGSGGGGSSNGTNHGGADGHNYGDGGSGGSGIVIIRYKFQ